MSVWTLNLPGARLRARPEQVAYFGALGALGVLGILEWPVTLVVAAGHYLLTRHHDNNDGDDVLDGLGEALEEA